MALLINGFRIEESSIEAEAKRVEQARSQGNVAPEDQLRPAREVALDGMINHILLRQEARRRVEVDPQDVDYEFDRLVKSCGGVEQFRQQYQVGEADDERFKKHLEDSIRLDRLLEQEGMGLTPDEHELSQYYAGHFDEFMAPEQIRVSHIVRNPGSGDPEEVYKKMCEARREIQSGVEFARVAEKYSECHSEPGGDLGFFAKGQMVEAFDAVVFSMAVDEVSPVFMTQFGFHVAKVTDKRAPRRRPFEEVRGLIAEKLRRVRRDAGSRSLANRLRATAEIREVPDLPKGGKKKGKKGKR